MGPSKGGGYGTPKHHNSTNYDAMTISLAEIQPVNLFSKTTFKCKQATSYFPHEQQRPDG